MEDPGDPASAAASGSPVAEQGWLSLRELRKALEEAADAATAKELLVANVELGLGRAQRSIGPRAVCALITQLGRSKQCDKAISVFEACPSLGIEPNSHIYSAIVSACSTSGRWEAALQYFGSARKAGAANEITYSAAIAACMRSNKMDRGLGLLEEMQQADMRPDAITYCTLLLAAQRAGQWDIQTSLLADMHSRGLVAPHKIYVMALDHYRVTGEWEAALNAFNGLQQAQQDAAAADAHAAAASAGAAAAAADGAPAAAAQHHPHHVPPAPADDPMLLLLLLRILLDAKQEPLAVDLLRRQEAMGPMAARTCLRAAELFASAGLESEAARMRATAAAAPDALPASAGGSSASGSRHAGVGCGGADTVSSPCRTEDSPRVNGSSRGDNAVIARGGESPHSVSSPASGSGSGSWHVGSAEDPSALAGSPGSAAMRARSGGGPLRGHAASRLASQQQGSPCAAGGPACGGWVPPPPPRGAGAPSRLGTSPPVACGYVPAPGGPPGAPWGGPWGPAQPWSAAASAATGPSGWPMMGTQPYMVAWPAGAHGSMAVAWMPQYMPATGAWVWPPAAYHPPPPPCPRAAPPVAAAARAVRRRAHCCRRRRPRRAPPLGRRADVGAGGGWGCGRGECCECTRAHRVCVCPWHRHLLAAESPPAVAACALPMSVPLS